MYNYINEPYNLPMYWVEQLVIEESLLDWNTKGYLIINSDLEFFERGIKDIKAPYTFRTDGRNKVKIKIIPCDEKNIPLKDPSWEMDFDFVIYDVQDVSSELPGKTQRLFYIKDERHQIFQERNLEWSTALNSLPQDKDNQKTKSGNVALKELIIAASKVEGGDKESLKVGCKDNVSIKMPNISLDTFDPGWDQGLEDDDVKLFYTSPANSTVLDDIDYLLQHTKAFDGSPVILDYGRHSQEKYWKLFSLKSLFQNSQKEDSLIEKLYINDTAEQTSARGNASSTAATIDRFSSGRASIILNYNYAPSTAVWDSSLINKPVYNYDFAEGKYNVYFKNNKIKTIIKDLEEMSAGLFSFKSGKAQIIHNLNQTKNSGITTKNVFIPQSFFLKDYSGIQMTKDLIFLSGTLYLQLPGLTMRTPGKFVMLDRSYNLFSGNRFDKRFLGQWLISKVTHTFSKGVYMNDLVCTKFDALDGIFPENDGAY